MNISIPSILTGLAGKCLLNWALVFFQGNHIWRSFVGVFSVSLSVADTTLTLFLTTIHLHASGQLLLFGWQLTRYHICLLVQIVGQVYSALQFPVIVATGLDHFYTLSQKSHSAASRRKWSVHSSITVLLWFVSTLYVFLLSNFRPVMEDVPHYHIRQCWAFYSFQILQVALLLLLTVVYATLHTVFSVRSKSPALGDQRRADSKRSVISQVLRTFQSFWCTFLFLAVLLLLSVAMPSYLGLNVAWLCFLSSFLMGVASSVVCPSVHMAPHWQQVLLTSVRGGVNLAWLQRTESECTHGIHAGSTTEDAELSNDT